EQGKSKELEKAFAINLKRLRQNLAEAAMLDLQGRLRQGPGARRGERRYIKQPRDRCCCAPKIGTRFTGFVLRKEPPFLLPFAQRVDVCGAVFLPLHAHNPFFRHALIIQHHASRIQHQPLEMKLLLIDGHYYVYRSFFAIPNLSNSRGEPTNAIFGFTKTLRLMLKHLQPQLGAVFWDEGLPQCRVELQPAYKETRKEMPGPMVPQLDFIRSTITPMLGFTNVALPDTEADDLMGCY